MLASYVFQTIVINEPDGLKKASIGAAVSDALIFAIICHELVVHSESDESFLRSCIFSVLSKSSGWKLLKYVKNSPRCTLFLVGK